MVLMLYYSRFLCREADDALSRRWWIRFPATFAGLALSLTACGGTSPTSSISSKAASATVTVAQANDAVCLLPYNTEDNLSYGIEADIYQGLIGYNAEMKIIPELAESWTSSPDAKTYTFHLNPKARFSDGTPVTALDVKKSFEFLLDPGHHLARTSLFAPISKISVLGKETVQFKLSKPFGAMLPTFAHPSAAVIEPSALTHTIKYLCDHPIGGSGKFIFQKWVPGTELVVVKNGHYWQPSLSAKVGKIIYRPVADASARMSGLETGQYQVIYPLPTQEISVLKKAKGIKIASGPNILVNYVALNTQVRPFNNVEVREALNYAINRATFIKTVWNGYGTVMHSPVAPGVAYYHRVGSYSYDLSKARALLKEAGYPHGFSTTLWSDNDTQSIEMDTAIQQALGAIGVKVTVQPMDSATVLTKLFSPGAKKNARMNLSDWSPSTGDADWGLRPLFDGADFPPTGYNIAFYSNPKLDSLIADGLSSAKPSIRNAAYLQAEKLIWQQAPWIFLGIETNLWGERSNVKGVVARPDDILLMDNASE